jgi:parallel beta-helix repeat protein
MVSNNVVSGNGTCGIVVTGGANNQVLNNTSTNNSGEGIVINYGATGTKVSGNNVSGNGSCINDAEGSSDIQGNSCDGSGGGAGGGPTTRLPAGGCAAAATPRSSQPSSTPPASQPSGGGSSSGGSSGGGTPAASSGQACFTLGGKDIAAKDFDIAKQWANAGATVTAYTDLAARIVGELGSLPAMGGQSRGIGVEGEIDTGEAMVLDFKTAQTHLNVGLRDIYVEGQPADGTETASWAAYKDGKAVAQGTVDGTAPLDKMEGYGTAEFQIDVPDGFNQVISRLGRL